MFLRRSLFSDGLLLVVEKVGKHGDKAALMQRQELPNSLSIKLSKLPVESMASSKRSPRPLDFLETKDPK
jgi:hypothetical protein